MLFHFVAFSYMYYSQSYRASNPKGLSLKNGCEPPLLWRNEINRLSQESRVQVGGCIECLHSRGEHLCKFMGTKESVCIRKELIFLRTGLGYQHGHRFFVLGHQHDHRFIVLGHQYGHRFIVLGHQHGLRDVIWKHYIQQVVGISFVFVFLPFSLESIRGTCP